MDAQPTPDEHLDARAGFARDILQAAVLTNVDSAKVKALGIHYGLLVNMGMRGDDAAGGTGDPNVYRIMSWLVER